MSNIYIKHEEGTLTLPEPYYISENPYVKAYIAALKQSGRSTEVSDFNDLTGAVGTQQREFELLMNELKSLRKRLDEVREYQNHPLKSMMQKALDNLSEKVNILQELLNSLKEKIINFCKEAVESIKDKGVSALDSVSQLAVKPELIALRYRTMDAIEQTTARADRIGRAAEEYHTARFYASNALRSLMGRDTVQGVKPKGKLAEIIESPFRSKIKRLERSLRGINKALKAVEKLEKNAAERAARIRPSTLTDLYEQAARNRERQYDTPVRTKAKTAEAER